MVTFNDKSVSSTIDIPGGKKNVHFLNNFFLRPTAVELTIMNYAKFIWLHANENRLTLSITFFCESR